MPIAELYGKMPCSDSEDLLTADVFTALRYLPAKEGIIGFLRSAAGMGAQIPEPDDSATCEVFFWPKGRHICREPDVLLELTIGSRVLHVLVEAKYQSGPSDYDTYEGEYEGKQETFGNQLADEFRDLLGDAFDVPGPREEKALVLSSRREDRYLLYLTAHVLRPDEDLTRCVQQCAESQGRLFWANWYQVHDHLADIWLRSAFPYRRIIDDAVALLSLKGFAPYEGLRLPPHIEGAVSGRFWTE